MSRGRFTRSSDIGPRPWRSGRLAAVLAVVCGALVGWVATAAAVPLVDSVAGVSIEVPAGWTGSAEPRGRGGRVVERAILASFPLPSAQHAPLCRVARRLHRALPDDGALVWVLERLTPRGVGLRSLPRRSGRLRLEGRETRGCFKGFYRWRYRTGGRSVTVVALAGEQAGDATRGQLLRAVASLELASVVVGRSRERRPIRLIAAGDPSASTRVLVVGCVHGDECAAARVLRILRSRPVRGVDLWLVPTLNPDGLAARTRQNAAGVDLNRNFPGTWEPIGSRGNRYYAGPRPASEPETRLGMEILRRLRPDVTVWFHQPERNVRAGGGSARAAQAYARLVGLPYLPLPVPPGAATAWQTRAQPESQAFVVELPLGLLSAGAALRHARALEQLAPSLRPGHGRG